MIFHVDVGVSRILGLALANGGGDLISAGVALDQISDEVVITRHRHMFVLEGLGIAVVLQTLFQLLFQRFYL